jgi:hypothetical protein
VSDNQALELDRKRRHADKQGAYRNRLRRRGMASVSTALPADLLQYVTEQRDRTGHRNLGAMLAEIVREHRARNLNSQSKESTVSA